MSNLGKHIELVWQYGKWIFLAGMMYNAVCAGFLAGAFSYAGLVYALILKLVFTAIVLYLHRVFEDRDAVFFYINLGMNRKGLLAWTLAVDFGVFVLMEILIALCQ